MRGRRSGERSRGIRQRECLCGACALGLVTPAPGRLRDPPWGHYDPCARCSLQTRPDRRGKRGPELRHRPRRCPRAAAGRREARRPASWAGDLRRSEDRPFREVGHRVRRFRTSACRRSAPLTFFRERKRTRGIRRPRSNRAAERWLFDNRIGGMRLRVIAREAKQSRATGKTGLLRRCAPRK
jgi:hypothetical protein